MKVSQIIDKAHLVKIYRKAAESAISVIGSGIVAYVVFLMTLVVWYFAGYYMVDTMFSWRHIEDTINMLMQLSLVALVSLMVFLSWGEYNFRNFAHRTQRTTPKYVEIAEVTAFFDTTAEELLAAQESKWMLFHIAEGKHVMCDLDNNRCISMIRFENDEEE